MIRPRIVVTGGAGYIGAHVCHLLKARGFSVTVLDDLSTGARKRVKQFEFVKLDLTMAPAEIIEQVLTGAVGVIHFAAVKRVDESVRDPLKYYSSNLVSLIRLLAAMRVCNVNAFVFSSSSSVYGEPRGPLVAEDSACFPVNPYGETKLVGEWLCQDASIAWGLRAVALRYFNVAGASCPILGDLYSMTLVPRLVNLALANEPLIVNGTDYPTSDGTCVRDYVHPEDVADAHLLTLERLLDGHDLEPAYNVGTGAGSSVLAVIQAAESVLGRPILTSYGPRRPGDPTAVVGNTSLIYEQLGWQPRYTLADIVSSAFAAHSYLRRIDNP